MSGSPENAPTERRDIPSSRAEILGVMLAGGRGYQENNALARLVRDAQAAYVKQISDNTDHTRLIDGLPL